VCSSDLNEIKQGYITIQGGHRIGLAGNYSQIGSIKSISSINIRISREIIGAADFIPKDICNILIASPPGYGKTTVLRDLIRQFSNMGYNISVIDERGELAGSFKGIAQLDLGNFTDILEGKQKHIGMILALRSLNPSIIAIDEIATKEDFEAINYISTMGINILATMHAKNEADLIKKPHFNKNLFDKVIFL
jgi:stage III sporulation protein AA